VHDISTEMTSRGTLTNHRLRQQQQQYPRQHWRIFRSDLRKSMLRTHLYAVAACCGASCLFLSAAFVVNCNKNYSCHVISQQWITDRLTRTPVAGRPIRRRIQLHNPAFDVDVVVGVIIPHWVAVNHQLVVTATIYPAT